MENQLFVSTNVFKTRELKEMLRLCQEYGIRNLELSTCDPFHWHMRKHLCKLGEKESFNFLVHNYFPPPEKPMILNLASEDVDVLSWSRNHCLMALDFAVDLGSPLYSVHAGFCFHASPENLGKKIDPTLRFPRDKAWKNFVESVIILLEKAEKLDLNLAIENNVLASFNLIHGKNELLLCVTAEEFHALFKEIESKKIGLLLDVGHLKVSAHSLGFSASEFITTLAPLTFALHLSDNNGFLDEHGCINENSWFWEYLASDFRNSFWILESNQCDIEAIIQQTQTISSKLQRFFSSR